LRVQRLDDVAAIYPTGHTVGLNWADVYAAVFPEPVLLDNGPVEAYEQTIVCLRNLEFGSRLEKHMHRLALGRLSRPATAFAAIRHDRLIIGTHGSEFLGRVPIRT
jgi:hypothetical protein